MHVYHSQTTQRLKGDQHCKIKGKMKKKKKYYFENMITTGKNFWKGQENFKFPAGTGEI